VTDSELSQEIQNFINAHITFHRDLKLYSYSPVIRSECGPAKRSRELRTNATYAQAQLKELARIVSLNAKNNKFASQQIHSFGFNLPSRNAIPSRSLVINLS